MDSKDWYSVVLFFRIGSVILFNFKVKCVDVSFMICKRKKVIVGF